ncbi:MAG: cyclic nucleotide-binding domain-containing protein [Lentisphaerae bacterium]|nr:cyclic nucleotide-binding domain-containing protein [Lentisphaerota bacterium]
MDESHTYRPIGDFSSIVPILNKISILGGLSEADLAVLFQRMETAVYEAGERIFLQGDSPTHIYIVRSGRVRIVVDIDTTPLELVEYVTGQCFGETSAIGIQPHSATAVAIERTAILALSARALHELYHADVRVFGLLILNIAREACRRLHRADQTFLHYATAKHAR